MKIINYALCALAGLVAFTSCSKADGQDTTEGKRSLRISINNDTTRADDDPVTGNVKSEYSSLYVYFTDGNNVVSTDVITTAEDIASFRTSGKSYDNISSSIKNVLIVANVKAGDALPTSAGTAVASVRNFAFAAASQQPDAANAENTKAGGLHVTMLGESGLTEDTSSAPAADGNKVMKAAVTLTPVVARVEISNALTAGEGVFSIQVDHVYLNNYYGDYSFERGALVNKGTDIANYTDNLQNDNYSADVIAGTKADAYHVFANGTSTVMPHIILEVSGHFKDAADAQGAEFTGKYLTIKKFTDTASTTEIAQMAANSIYKIDLSKLTVPASVLDPTPEAGRISLSVSVEVEEWTIVNVAPEL